MKILFFSNIPIRTQTKEGYNGGGWISSLIEHLSENPENEVAVGYYGNTDSKYKENSLTTYQIKEISFLKDIIQRFLFLTPFAFTSEKKTWKYHEKRLLEVINDFKPDIIHIFGSECQFGLISNQTDIPTVIHIQGILNPYYNAHLPPFFSWYDLHQNLISLIKSHKERNRLFANCLREREIFIRNKNFIGRTEWDKRITNILNPEANYYYGGEILRSDFYKKWERTIPAKLTIPSTISKPIYKGYDTILKTAYLLKKFYKKDFTWNVYGNIDAPIIEKTIGIKHEDVNVQVVGVANTERLIQSITKSTVYVHPSYIDNSPNSVCEAQILGVPVIAANVGGLPSIINDGETGFLVPANDPYQMAYLIQHLQKDENLNQHIGENARLQALKRHDCETIIKQLVEVYDNILSSSKKR